MRPISSRVLGEQKNKMCPFYEWNLEHCHHITANTVNVLKALGYCFSNYRACSHYGDFARTPEGAAELRRQLGSIPSVQ